MADELDVALFGCCCRHDSGYHSSRRPQGDDALYVSEPYSAVRQTADMCILLGCTYFPYAFIAISRVSLVLLVTCSRFKFVIAKLMLCF